MKKIILGMLLLSSTTMFAQIHQSCHSDNHDSHVFAVAYTGAVLDIKRDEVVDGKPLYQMPELNYEQGFDAVCKVIDAHPELWERPSRDAIAFAASTLWKRKD